jgi:hypothetical protein
MAVCRHRGSHVNQVHDLSAKKFPQRIRLRGQNDLRHPRA